MELIVTPRTILGKKVKQLRRNNAVPGVLYGKGEENICVSFDKNAFLKVYKEVGRSMPLDITSGDGKIEQMVLIHTVGLHPVTDALWHVDFHIIHKGEKVHAEVALRFEGVSPVEKAKLGRLEFLKDSVSVVAFPKDLPKEIIVDISKIATLQDVLFVSDLITAEGVEIEDDKEHPVVTAVAFKEEEEAPAATATDAAGAAGAAGAAATPAAAPAADKGKGKDKK